MLGRLAQENEGRSLNNARCCRAAGSPKPVRIILPHRRLSQSESGLTCPRGRIAEPSTPELYPRISSRCYALTVAADRMAGERTANAQERDRTNRWTPHHRGAVDSSAGFLLRFFSKLIHCARNGRDRILPPVARATERLPSRPDLSSCSQRGALGGTTYLSVTRHSAGEISVSSS